MTVSLKRYTPPRPGSAEGGITSNIWGLAVRLNLGTIIAWFIGFVGYGAVTGTLVKSMGDLVRANPLIAMVIESASSGVNISMSFVVTILQIIAILAAVMGVGIVLRMYHEEVNNRVEPLLATSLRRSTYMASNVVVAFAAAGLGMLLAGLSLGFVAHYQDNSIIVRDVVQQALATIPAVWVLVSIAVMLIGVKPTRSFVAWLAVVATFGLTILGPTFRLSDRVMDISPLRHVPMVAAPDIEWTGLLGLGSVCLVLLAIGFTGFSRRDIV